MSSSSSLKSSKDANKISIISFLGNGGGNGNVLAWVRVG